MSPTDYLIAAAAMALVLWNLRRHPLTDRRLRRPLLIAAGMCAFFLHGVPTDGADGALVGIGVALGAGCGVLGAAATRLEWDGAQVVASASALAATVTAVAFGGRIAFAIAATHGLGPAIGAFSRDVGIHSEQAWVAALVLMGAADLVVRALILWRRRELCAPPAFA
jgi:hypothetical protein